MESLEDRALLTTLLVTDAGDAGPGTFRHAVETANVDPSVNKIRFAPGLTIETLAPVTYTNTQSISLLGRNTVVQPAGSGDFNLFESLGGGDLSLRDMTFQLAGDNGVFVEVPASSTGSINVSLTNVSLLNNGLSGMIIDDQANDSDAGVRLRMWRSEVVGNGFKPNIDDFDGIRINEGGEGSVRANIKFSTFESNAGDGLEIDEKGDGDVRANVFATDFNNNGAQPQLPEDLEDGFDIDEAGDGSIHVRLLHVEANGNFDEGIDLDEEGNGDLIARLAHVQANGNGDEGIKFSEDADAEPPDENVAPDNENASGDIRAHFFAVTANFNGDDGIELEEFGPGSLIAYLAFVEASGNAKDGFQASEGSEDYPAAIADDQNAGDLRVRVAFSKFKNNLDGAGIKVDQVGPGVGLLWLLFADFGGNFDGPVDADGVDVFGL